MSIEFATVEEAAEEFRQGRQIVLVDDEDRENEGDLALPAEKITPAAINFMAKHGRGLICLALTEERCDELHLPPMSPGEYFRAAARPSPNRSTRAAEPPPASAPPIAPPPSLRPSIPPRARPIWRALGTSSRCARGEAACWSAPDRPKRRWTWRASPGSTPAGVICEIMNDDGTHGAPAAARRILPRARSEAADRRGADPLPHAPRALRAPRCRDGPRHALRRFPHDRLFAATWIANSTSRSCAAICPGRRRSCACIRTASPAMSSASTACDCYEIVARSLEAIVREDRGIFVYLHHTGRGFQLEQPPADRANCRAWPITLAARSIRTSRGSGCCSMKAASARRS